MRMTIYCDQTSEEAPIDRNANVQVLAHVEADVSHIPEHLLNRRQGKDGQMYYELSCKIEAVYLSASTTYTLLYNSMCLPFSRSRLHCHQTPLPFGASG
jgi:hypothetical protein